MFRADQMRQLFQPDVYRRMAQYDPRAESLAMMTYPELPPFTGRLQFTASGTGVMQAALENCVARRVLVTTCGAFSA